MNDLFHVEKPKPGLDQWFTPFWAAEQLVEDALAPLGDVSVVEPSCGTGAFLAAVPARCPALGVEIDPQLVPIARQNSGREVILGDFRDVPIEREVQAIVGNPPFSTRTVEEFLARGHDLLPEDGLIALILPAYCFQTPNRVTRWMDRFAIDVSLIPRTLFPRLSKPLVWAKYRKTRDRLFHGLMLFVEQRDVEVMPEHVRRAVEGPGTWREAVRAALEGLGGEASLQSIYDQISPARRSRKHWRPKVRQVLQLHFQPVRRGRWAICE